MSLLIGRYEYSLDDKNRVNIPAKFRKNLSPEAENTYVITKGDVGCLDVYPMHIFISKYVEKYNQYSETEPAQRFHTSLKGEDSEESTLDGQGRISIPKHLLEYAGITKEVVIIGAIHRIELWDPAVRKAYLAQQKPEISKELMP